MKIQQSVSVFSLFVILSTAILACHQSPGTSQASEGSTDAALFVHDNADALNSKDLAKLKKMLHPKVLACINNEKQEFWDFVLAQSEETTICFCP